MCPTYNIPKVVSSFLVFDVLYDLLGTLWNDELEGDVNGLSWSNAILIRKVFPVDDWAPTIDFFGL